MIEELKGLNLAICLNSWNSCHVWIELHPVIAPLWQFVFHPPGSRCPLSWSSADIKGFFSAMSFSSPRWTTWPFVEFSQGFIRIIPAGTWGRGWMTKASGVGERRKGRGELRRDCHHRVAALFVPTRMQQWYIDIWYITMIYMGEGAGGGPFRGKNHVMSLSSPPNTC